MSERSVPYTFCTLIQSKQSHWNTFYSFFLCGKLFRKWIYRFPWNIPKKFEWSQAAKYRTFLYTIQTLIKQFLEGFLKFFKTSKQYCGSVPVPLTYGSGSCSFLQWLSRCQQKITVFLLIASLKVHLHSVSKDKSHKEVTKQDKSRLFLVYLLDDGRIRIRTNNDKIRDAQKLMDQEIGIRIWIHNTAKCFQMSKDLIWHILNTIKL